MHLKLEYSISRDFLRNIMISAFESGVHGTQSWATVLECRDTSSKGYDSVYMSYDRKTGAEGDRKGRRLLELDDLVEGIRRLLASKRIDLGSDLRGRIASAVNNDDSGEIDGPLADVIVQAAIFNDVIYG
jgi:hypothetical protein